MNVLAIDIGGTHDYGLQYPHLTNRRCQRFERLVIESGARLAGVGIDGVDRNRPGAYLFLLDREQGIEAPTQARLTCCGHVSS